MMMILSLLYDLKKDEAHKTLVFSKNFKYIVSYIYFKYVITIMSERNLHHANDDIKESIILFERLEIYVLKINLQILLI